MTGFSDLLGVGSSGEQFLLWNVGSQFSGALLTPIIVGLQAEVWAAALAASGGALYQPLPPAQLASMVLKSIIPGQFGEVEAAKFGITAGDFAAMVKDVGEPPGLSTVLEMWRRKYIPWDSGDITVPSVVSAILSSHIRNEWAGPIQQLASVPLPPGDAVNAALRGQRAQADMEVEAWLSGLDADRFRILLDTAGNPPSLTELLDLKRRGLIPDMGLGAAALTFQQGIAEGDTKNKWLPLYLDLAAYIPPPRSITTLQTHGVISPAQATRMYTDAGLTPDVAQIYTASATAVKVTAHKEVTEANILKLYYSKLVDGPTATTMLANLGYDGPTAAYLLELQDFNRAVAAYDSAVTRVGTMYVGHKIDRQSALDALTSLDVPAVARTHLIQTWDQETAVNLKTLSAAEIADAFVYNIFDQPTALGELEAIGYTPWDAWVYLSVKAKGPLPNPPAPGPNAQGVNPTT